MEVKLPDLLENYDRQPNQPTDRPTNRRRTDRQGLREVSLLMIYLVWLKLKRNVYPVYEFMLIHLVNTRWPMFLALSILFKWHGLEKKLILYESTWLSDHEIGGGGSFSIQKNCCRFWNFKQGFLVMKLENFATWFSENEGRGQRPDGTFQKFIRFGAATPP